jgi:hypothetical protein
MGVVYEAYDRQRDALVALKTLRRLEPGGLYLFKQEFRALADVTHPNLVTLYELLVSEGQWFFTMELLEGVGFLAHLRGESPPPRSVAAPTGSDTATTTATASLLRLPEIPESSSSSAHEVISPPVDGAAVRPLLLQLAEGIAALHASGHLHCDIKPSNVLVTPQGRVVVLDYGVITEMGQGGTAPAPLAFRGTPAYTSPEHAAGQRHTPASDWYSVGVILYQALTGRRPFYGTVATILRRKQVEDPPAPHAVCTSVDPDLADLCMKLLARDPTQRPTGAEVLAALRGSVARPLSELIAESVSPPAPLEAAFIGRDRELQCLRAAFEESRGGQGVAVRLKGRSGVGKTALAARFLDSIAERDQALILSGRCYERESVPHQAVDGLVDALCQYLLGLPRAEAELLMPLDVPAMARAFPVLGRVEAVIGARRRSTIAVTDPVELRRRAYAALTEVFARIAERQPLVLFIDDLQWGDVDSAPFLADLLEPPAPPLMLIISYRAEESDSSPLLQTLLHSEEAADSVLAKASEISVGRLSIAHARELASALLMEEGASTALAERIARESGGSPFFVHELVRYVISQHGGGAADVPPLAEVLLARAASQSPGARELLRVVAVAGKPIFEAVARRAARTDDQHLRAIAELRSAHLVRTTGLDGSLMIETYHDRIRESLTRSLSDEVLRTIHLRIAESIEAASVNDPEALARHYAGAGERSAASHYAAIAADKAADSLAFDRAATFYRLALDLTEADQHDTLARLGGRLGDSLVNAGRGAEAPAVYLAAAAVAARQDARDLQVRAGSELLRSGRVGEGVEVLRQPLESAGIMLARSKGRAAFSLLSRRAYSRLRGLRFERRDPSQMTPEIRTQIDACHAAAAGLAMVDPLRGAYVQTRHLMTALSRGDLFRVGRALTYEGGFLCIAGPASVARVGKILRTVRAIADQLEEPYLEALQHTHSALAEYQCGKWGSAREHALLAETTYRDKCTGSAWELSSVQMYGLWSLYWLGDLKELKERVLATRRDAKERGDLYATVCLNIGLPSFAGLVVDDVAGTRHRAEEAARQWTHGDYHLQHFWTAIALAQCDLYSNDPVAASARMEAQWPLLRRAFLLKVVMVRAETLHLRARCAVAAALVSDDRRRYLRLARRIIRRLRTLDLPWCRPAADLLLASVHSMMGRRDGTLALLKEAELGLRAADTHAFAAAAQRRRGELLGENEGTELIAAADAWFEKQTVARPEQMARLLAPGFAPSRAALPPSSTER